MPSHELAATAVPLMQKGVSRVGLPRRRPWGTVCSSLKAVGLDRGFQPFHPTVYFVIHLSRRAAACPALLRQRGRARLPSPEALSYPGRVPSLRQE